MSDSISALRSMPGTGSGIDLSHCSHLLADNTRHTQCHFNQFVELLQNCASNPEMLSAAASAAALRSSSLKCSMFFSYLLISLSTPRPRTLKAQRSILDFAPVDLPQQGVLGLGGPPVPPVAAPPGRRDRAPDPGRPGRAELQLQVGDLAYGSLCSLERTETNWFRECSCDT